MIILTILNTLAIVYLLIAKQTHLSISLRNKRKVELEEEVNRMISKYSHQAKLQHLSATFSWLKTWEQVRQFEKDYSVVDRKIVENLVANFKPKA